MTRILFAGYHAARDAGLFTASPPIEYVLTTGAALDPDSADADAVYESDLSFSEFDGVGYQRYAPDHTWEYDDTTKLKRLIPEAGAGGEFGSPSVAPGGGGPPTGLLEVMVVDGDPTHDFVVAWSDEGAFADGNGGPLGYTFPENGTLTSGPAA